MICRILIIVFLIPKIFIFVVPTYADTHDQINIFVSIPPQKYLVEQIGGDRVSVNIMVKPGVNPETYEPTPKQMAALNETHLYFQIGVPFESVWIDKIKNTNQQLLVIDCCENLIAQNESNYELDAHIWTSPLNAKKLATIIKEALVEYEPENQSVYENKYKLLIDELNALDKEIRKKLSRINNRYLIVSHPSWGHFARTYDLEQLSIEQDGSEIRAKQLAKLVEFAKSENIKTIYYQKQINNASAKILAKEIDARLVELDPLAENYVENLRLVTNQILQGVE